MAEAFISRHGGWGVKTINGQEIIDVVFGETINRGDRVVVYPPAPSLKLEDPSTLPTDWGNGCAFSPDGTYLAVAHDSSPYITIYKGGGYRAHLYIDSSTYGSGSLLGYAVESGTSNELRKVAKLFAI